MDALAGGHPLSEIFCRPLLFMIRLTKSFASLALLSQCPIYHTFVLTRPSAIKQNSIEHGLFREASLVPQNRHPRCRSCAQPCQREKLRVHRLLDTRLQSLIPLEIVELDQLLALGTPTAAQYSTYFGRTKQEQYARLVESCIVGFLGVFFSYFMSFVLGGWVATLFGTLFLFWGVLSPEFKARQRNWEFLGGRPLVDVYQREERQGLYGALFLGVIEDICVVQNSDDELEYDLAEFAEYRMEQDELERYTGAPWLLRVKCVDSTSRRLQVHARLSEEYLDVARGAGVVGILLSKTPDFTTLAAISDLFCPSAQCWIGDYPYLDRAETERLLAENDSVWDAFEREEATAVVTSDIPEALL